MNSTQSSSRRPKNQSAEEHGAFYAVTIFPLLILAAGVLGFLVPGAFAGLTGWVNPLLGFIMFGMGLTLTFPDFGMVARRPIPVVIGVIAQFVIMPFLGWFVSSALQLPPELAIGVILVGCCPGGTASNVVSYLAKGDVALSVAMTTISTLIAPFVTPVLAVLLAGERMSVSGASMMMSILQVVLAPVVLGLLIRWLMPRFVNRVTAALPWASVVAISVIVAIVVSGSAAAIVSAGLLVLVAVILHNGLGYALGYGAAAMFRLVPSARRTTAIEVGMQNSGLATSLAHTYFTPEAALPGAVFSVWHNVSGALLAAVLRRRAVSER
ncbi:bile acid:sodium symporter family protein [uncultured Kocuria sp.]|uniref:bile acid:sodium symporter family protein n=1 Tax=uncultured Kocuria sp. TaxID=259305 RepID=UPI002593304F|nr:bile acid:sodium symporter family protein [uncultured Kocuria sp.]MCT1366439.1 bile acid:sodium symporter family protein [Rothia sp. p3-SID1597]